MNIVVGSCTQTREQLSDYLDGELTGLRRMRVRLHLAGCDACSAVARSLRITIERLHELDEASVPEPAASVTPVVLERIQPHDAERAQPPG